MGDDGGVVRALRRRDGREVWRARLGAPCGDGLAAVEAAGRANGRDGALLITPLGPDEGELGPKLVAALVRAGVRRIVAVGIQNAEAMREIPHFAAKLPMQRAVVEAGGTVLRISRTGMAWFVCDGDCTDGNGGCVINAGSDPEGRTAATVAGAAPPGARR